MRPSLLVKFVALGDGTTNPLLMPVALGLADVFGFREGSRGRIGIAMTAGLGAFLPGFGVMPANVPNLVMIGAADTLYGLKPVYGAYLLLGCDGSCAGGVPCSRHLAAGRCSSSQLPLGPSMRASYVGLETVLFHNGATGAYTKSPPCSMRTTVMRMGTCT